MKRITIYDVDLVEYLENTFNELVFVASEDFGMYADITDEGFNKIQEQMFLALDNTGHSMNDIIIEAL